MRRAESLAIAGTAVVFCVALTACRAKTAVQDYAVHSYALRLCDEMPHTSGEECKSAVEANYARCSKPFLAQESHAAVFAECLGFVLRRPEPPATTLAECRTPDIRIRLSLSIARSTSWPGSRAHDVNGERLYVGDTKVIDETDVTALRLEDRSGDRMIVLELSPDGAKNLATATQSNIDNSMVISMSEKEIAARIASPITDGKLVLLSPDATPASVCRTN